ncbi:MAG TPA: urate oxidase [Candidatus Limnocylindria bacterium]|jgi:urate oxidase|nr:urate oxidase [Candidatus Limnocylindria bacterium]
MTTEIQYGKTRVLFYRLATTAAAPFAASVDVDVFGERFLAAYTKGDNREVVATDTMKNFVYATAADFKGDSLESYTSFLGHHLLGTYPQMERIRVAAREVALDPASGPQGPSNVVFRLTRTDAAFAEGAFERRGSYSAMTEARSGLAGLVLLKTTGSSFAAFARDQYTTLPELKDRPLTIRLDAHWRYADLQDASGDGDGHVPAARVRESLETTFHEFNSRSIQHLVHEMGTRLLARFESLSEIGFAGENHTPDLVKEGSGTVSVFAEPRQTFGKIGLVLRR